MGRPARSIKIDQETGKRLYNRRCDNCGSWFVSRTPGRSGMGYTYCQDCKMMLKKVSRDAEFNRIPPGAYIVINCPDPYGYRAGAAFDRTQWRAMKTVGGLIPGMIVRHNGIIIEIDQQLKEKRKKNDKR